MNETSARGWSIRSARPTTIIKAGYVERDNLSSLINDISPGEELISTRYSPKSWILSNDLMMNETLPRHVAIIMDGNGRWAQRRGLPRTEGHRAGLKAVRKTIEQAAKRGVEILTLFAFSSENWRRPYTEVQTLLQLFQQALTRELPQLKENGIRLRIIGDRRRFSASLQEAIARAEEETKEGERLTLVVAASYGGRWDIVQAARRMAERVAAGALSPAQISEALFARHLALAEFPEPDLFIRTGGEQRLSNFLLWDLAYTELYFTETLWPDFDSKEFDRALEAFARRERRFGSTSEQLAGGRR